MSVLDLTPDELLSTTRAVRKRLDLTRPVEWEVLEDCLRLAQQAPSGGLRQGWHFVVVMDSAKRAALAELYRKGHFDVPRDPDGLAAFIERRAANMTPDAADPKAAYGRLIDSVLYLYDHMHEVPALVVPCVEWPATEPGELGVHGPGPWASVIQATWSFMLAARARGLGTVWTSVSLVCEEEVAELLGIPYPTVRQVALIPVAYTIGTTFRPGPRAPLDRMLHRDDW